MASRSAGVGPSTRRRVLMVLSSVLQRGVNDDVATMGLLLKRLGYVNVHPYYVYMHDLVKGVEYRGDDAITQSLVKAVLTILP